MALDDHAHAGSLPCGTLLDDLIAQVTEGSPAADRAHQAVCRYCAAALEALREVWEDFQRLTQSAVAVPGDLAERVMTRVRGLGRAGDGGVLLTGAGGTTRVTDAVLARLARAGALDAEGVVWASVLSAGEAPERAGDVAISLRLVISYGAVVADVADGIRARITERLRTQTGATVARIDIAVEDVVVDAGQVSGNFSAAARSDVV